MAVVHLQTSTCCRPLAVPLTPTQHDSKQSQRPPSSSSPSPTKITRILFYAKVSLLCCPLPAPSERAVEALFDACAQPQPHPDSALRRAACRQMQPQIDEAFGSYLRMAHGLVFKHHPRALFAVSKVEQSSAKADNRVDEPPNHGS